MFTQLRVMVHAKDFNFDVVSTWTWVWIMHTQWEVLFLGLAGGGFWLTGEDDS